MSLIDEPLLYKLFFFRIKYLYILSNEEKNEKESNNIYCMPTARQC